MTISASSLVPSYNVTDVTDPLPSIDLIPFSSWNLIPFFS